jgi:hypothetical protein
VSKWIDPTGGKLHVEKEVHANLQYIREFNEMEPAARFAARLAAIAKARDRAGEK